MGVPVQPNTTCDIYHQGNNPPAAPDVAGVAIALIAEYDRASERGDSTTDVNLHWSHVALMPATTDVRDGYAGGTFAAGGAGKIYVPDKNGTAFQVAFVELRGRGTAYAHKRVYLQRQTPTWPTNEL
jgi:hypothetical protein